MEPLEAKFNIQTSSSSDSIATSFTNIRNYFVSTVNQQKHQRYYPAKYSSIIKEAGPSFEAILTIDADSAREASENHIALVRMATSIKPAKWNERILESYKPEMISNMLLNQSMHPDDFTSDYCNLLLKASGINFNAINSFPRKQLLINFVIFIIVMLIIFSFI